MHNPYIIYFVVRIPSVLCNKQIKSTSLYFIENNLVDLDHFKEVNKMQKKDTVAKLCGVQVVL